MWEEIYKEFREGTDRNFCQQLVKRSPSRLSHETTDGNKCRECLWKCLSVAKINQRIHWSLKKNQWNQNPRCGCDWQPFLSSVYSLTPENCNSVF